MRFLLPLLCACVLSGCASFDPYNGMAFEEFNHSAGLAGKGGAQSIGTNGSTEVYFLNGATDHEVFYWFEDGILRKVTHSSLPSAKQALKTMYKPAHLKTRKKTPKETSVDAGRNLDVAG